MNPRPLTILDTLRRVRAIAQNGLAYTEGHFDRERYEELYELSTESIGTLFDTPPETLFIPHDDQTGYATPKVGCRGGLFKEGKVLLARERDDDRWSLPGGWIDVNDSPQEAVAKEFVQETGLVVRPVRLCMIADGRKRGSEPPVHHVYTLVFLCEYLSGTPSTSFETSEVQYFPVDALPELSSKRTRPEYITVALAHHRGELIAAQFD